MLEYFLSPVKLSGPLPLLPTDGVVRPLRPLWLRTWNCVNQKQPSPFMYFGHWFIQQLLKLLNKPCFILLEIQHCRQLDRNQGKQFNTKLLLRQRERTYAAALRAGKMDRKLKETKWRMARGGMGRRRRAVKWMRVKSNRPSRQLSNIRFYLPARLYASAGNSHSNVSVCPSVCHAPVLCQNEES